MFRERGELAQLRARLIEPVAAKMADGFFSSFNRLVGDASNGSG
jgi:carbon monoxide dehydrogenase subunit G